MAEVGKWEINNIVVASFVVILIVVGTLVFLVSLAQNQANTQEVQPGGVQGTLVSYDFSTVQEAGAWESTAVELLWSGQLIDGKQGVVVLHPVSTTQSRYMENKVKLPPNNKYKLQAVAANIAGKASFANATGCDDSIIALSAKNGGKEKNQDFVVNSKDGWVTLSIDISEFAGAEVTVRISGVSGGSCGNWAGEWNAIDKLEIISYK